VVAAAAARDANDDVIFGFTNKWLQRTTLPDGRDLFAARFVRALVEARERRDSGERRALLEGALAAATTSEPLRDGGVRTRRDGDGSLSDIFAFAEECAALDGDPETVLFTAVQAQWRTNVHVAFKLTQFAAGSAAVPLSLGCGPLMLIAPLPARTYSWVPSPQLARGFGPQNPACVLTGYATHHGGVPVKPFVADESVQAAADVLWSTFDRSLHALVADAYSLEVPPDLAEEMQAVAAAQQRSKPPPPRGFGRAVPKTKQAAPPVSIELSGTPEATQQWCEPSTRTILAPCILCRQVRILLCCIPLPSASIPGRRLALLSSSSRLFMGCETTPSRR
jgi:hypothetical protein